MLYGTAECRRANAAFATRLCAGIGAILLGVIACVGVAEFAGPTWGTAIAERCAGTAALIGITIGVPLIVYAGLQKSKYDTEAYNRGSRPQTGGEPLAERISGAIMLCATAIFLACGFIWNLWHPAWAVFPIGGILCAVVETLLGKDAGRRENGAGKEENGV